MNLIINLFKKTELVFWEEVSREAYRGVTFTAFQTGVENRYLNPVIQESPLQDSDIKETLKEIQSFYAPSALPWIWIFQSEFCSKGFEECLEKQGFELLDESVAMALDLESNNFDHSIEGFSVQEVSDLEDWGVSMEAFGSDELTTQQYIQAHQSKKKEPSKLRHFVGYYQSTPVAAATLSFSEHGARLDDIATRTPYQRKGYASALLAHILRQVKALRARHCFLESSEDGLKLYTKIGFKPIFVNKVFGLVAGVEPTKNS